MLPNSLTSEEVILQSVMITPGSFDLVSDLVDPEDFYSTYNGHIFAAVRTVSDAGEEIGTPTVFAALEDAGKARDDTWSRLTQLFVGEITPSHEQLKSSARRVRGLADRRRVYEAAMVAASESLNMEVPHEEAISNAENALCAATLNVATEDPMTEIGDVMADAVEALGDRSKGLSGEAIGYGINALDEFTGGMMPGDLVIVAGRPGMGKTALALTPLLQSAIDKAEGHAIFFSLEMTKQEVAERTIANKSSQGKATASALRKGTQLTRDDWGEIARVTSDVADRGRIHVDETPGITLPQLRSRARKVASKSSMTLATGKRAYYAQREMPLAEACDYASQVMVDNMMARDAEEGIGAFIEKRAPSLIRVADPSTI